MEPQVTQFPSLLAGHQIIGADLLDAWCELLFHISRFGQPVKLIKGPRRELYNVKVLVTDPAWLPDEAYVPFSLDKARLLETARSLMDGRLPDDAAYTYGYRLHTHFNKDLIGLVIDRLSVEREDRHCHVSLWDTSLDFTFRDHGQALSGPCWVSAFWRIGQPDLDNVSRLYMSAVFRTHRAYTAWVENAHALSYLNILMADSLKHRLRIDLKPGPLTIYSQSISIDPDQLSLVEGVIGARKWRLRDDGRGQLTIRLDNGLIVVEHLLNGVLLKRYSGKRAEILAHALALDAVVSDFGHALYIGRQLGKLELCLQNGLDYDEA